MSKNNKGFVKLSRDFLDWQWSSNSNVAYLYFYMLLKANYTKKMWQGEEIKEGQFVASIGKLSAETGLSTQQIRTAIIKLENTKYITTSKISKTTLFTINSWEEEQGVTNKEQSNNNEITITKEIKKERNKEKKIQKKENVEIVKKEYFKNQELNQLFLEFLENRKNLKVQNTERAINLLLNKLNEFDDNVKKKMLENSILNNWKSIFPLNKIELEKIPVSDGLQILKAEDFNEWD